MTSALSAADKAAAREQTREANESGTLEKFVYDAIRLAGGTARSLTSPQRSRALNAPSVTTARGKALGRWIMKGGDAPGENPSQGTQLAPEKAVADSQEQVQSTKKEEPVTATTQETQVAEKKVAEVSETTPGKMEAKYGADIMARSKLAAQNTPYTHATGPKDHARIEAAAKELLGERDTAINATGIQSLIDDEGKVDKELLKKLGGYSSGRTKESLEAWLTQVAA
jgi:hypothetical protein